MKGTVFYPEIKLSFGVSRGLNIFLLLLLFAVFAVLAPTAHAATYTVTNLNNAGVGSLRQAVIDANAAAGADIINFSISGTITLVSSLPDITDAAGLTIDGTGHTVTISGNNSVRVTAVSVGTSLTLNNLTIANGSAVTGGGIYNYGSLTVTNSTFSGNSAEEDGGGILNNNINASLTMLTITNSTFSGNSAGEEGGGGISNNNGTVTITNSTFSGNSADNGEGGGNGGGIANADTVTVVNSTFSGNSAGGLGGGIYTLSGTVTISNTIIANSASGGNCSGTITNGGNNIDDLTTCGWGSTNGSMSGTDPLLGPLASNGGPTQTMALLTGSPAIDGVTFSSPNGAPATDQRGVSRPQISGFDIGAYEYQAASVSVPTMNEWGLIIFMILAGLGAIYFIRRQKRVES